MHWNDNLQSWQVSLLHSNQNLQSWYSYSLLSFDRAYCIKLCQSASLPSGLPVKAKQDEDPT